MMIETMAQASFVFDRPDYWTSAKASADYIVGSMMTGGGLKRVSFEGNIGVDGQLADYAGLGVALHALEDFTPDGEQKPDYSKSTRRLAEDIRARFADKAEFEGKPFLMTSTDQGLGNFAPVDDNPIPSGNSLALKLFNQIAERNGDLEFKKRSRVLTASLSGYALASPQSRGTLVKTAFSISNKPVGNIRYVANGNVRVGLKLDREKQNFHLDVQMKKGWHINSTRPLEDYFVPTVLSFNGKAVEPAKYPTPLEKVLRFNDKPLSLYEERLQLSDKYQPNTSDQPHTISLDVQACSDEICLEPETLKFNFWAN